MWHGRRGRPARVAALCVLTVGVVAACGSVPGARSSAPSATGTLAPTPSTTTSPSVSPAAAMRSSAPSPVTHPRPTSGSPGGQPCARTVLLGYSVQHRAISACERGTAGGVALVVVGVIHGDERFGLSVLDRLRSLGVPIGVDLWTISTVNPDGLAAGTRQNAHHVDLNRNWPGTWRQSSPGTPTYGGPSAASEPETRALRDFLLRLRPRTVVVFHSPLNAVDFSEGADPAVTRYLAQASGYPARTLGARPGSFTGWFNAQPWGGTALTFEFAATASSAQLSRVARALVQLAVWRRG